MSTSLDDLHKERFEMFDLLESINKQKRRLRINSELNADNPKIKSFIDRDIGRAIHSAHRAAANITKLNAKIKAENIRLEQEKKDNGAKLRLLKLQGTK